MPWDFKRYGSTFDPVHKSHLNELTGEYGCPRRFRYQRDAEQLDDTAQADASDAQPKPLKAALACGTAVHETIARALNNLVVRDGLLRGQMPTDKRVRDTLVDELAAAADGRELDWGKDKRDEEIADCVAMVQGLFESLPKYVEGVVAVEPGFVCEVEGVYYCGHVDMVFVPRGEPAALGIADWKTGASKPDPLELQHGWEAGIYSAALLRGQFLARERVVLTPRDGGGWVGQCGAARVEATSRWVAERRALEGALQGIAQGADLDAQFAFEQYPARIYHVHLRDFVPYQKSGAKEAKRPEDLDWYGLQSPARVKYEAGQRRGPAWLPVALHENDLPRLAYRSRTVVGTVRMGRFFDLVREHCRRCPFARDCLTGGYSARGDELTELQANLRKAGL